MRRDGKSCVPDGVSLGNVQRTRPPDGAAFDGAKILVDLHHVVELRALRCVQLGRPTSEPDLYGRGLRRRQHAGWW